MSRSLYTAFGFRRILYPINRSLKRHGLTYTIRNIVGKVSPGYKVSCPKQTEKVLETKRTLLICNHPAEADVLLMLAAIPPRQDVYLVAMHGLLSILPAINKHLIPVFISHRIDNDSCHDWKYRLFKKLHSIPEYSKAVAHLKNVNSIAKASRKIDHGSLVGIFPSGGGKYGSPFLPGVGHLIKNLKYPTQTHVVMAHVSGTSSWDFFRILPLVNRLLPKFKIEFSLPIPASRINQGSGRTIAQKLEAQYYSWANPFEPVPKFRAALLYLRTVLFFIMFRN